VKEITVDTHVVVYAIEQGDPDACEFLHGHMRRNKIVLDHEACIHQEYQRQFKDKGQSERRFQKWWVDVSSKAERYVRYTSKPYGDDKEEFVRVGFSPKDWKFAAVCSRSADKILVSEDTDFDCVREYLEKKRGVSIKKVDQILTEHRGRE